MYTMNPNIKDFVPASEQVSDADSPSPKARWHDLMTKQREAKTSRAKPSDHVTSISEHAIGDTAAPNWGENVTISQVPSNQETSGSSPAGPSGEQTGVDRLIGTSIYVPKAKRTEVNRFVSPSASTLPMNSANSSKPMATPVSQKSSADIKQPVRPEESLRADKGFSTVVKEETDTKATQNEPAAHRASIPGIADGSNPDATIGAAGPQEERHGRGARWATSEEMKLLKAPRKPIKEEVISDVASNVADNGEDGGVRVVGGGENNAALLADWTGNWAPVTDDWENRTSTLHGDTGNARRVIEWFPSIAEEEYSSMDITDDRISQDHQLVPRYWLPMSVDGLDPLQWWVKHMREPEIEPNSVPFWFSYPHYDLDILRNPEVPDACVDLSDPESAAGKELTAEHSVSTFVKDVKHKEQEEKKRRNEQARIAKEAARYVPAPNIYAPRVSMYMRPAKGAADVKQITEIYNHYINNSIACPEIEDLTIAQVKERFEDVTEFRLPFLVAVDKTPKPKGARKTAELILGFAFADDYNDMRGMYRYTVEIEMFVHPSFRRKGVAGCLLDKILQVLDTLYVPRGGYTFDGDDTTYGSGGTRVIQTAVINLPYGTVDKEVDSVVEGPQKLEWMSSWLSQFGFVLKGQLEEVGHKMNNVVNQAIFVRRNASTVQPLAR